MGKLVAHRLVTAALWVQIQTSLKKWATKAKEWPTHSSPPKIIYKKVLDNCLFKINEFERFKFE